MSGEGPAGTGQGMLIDGAGYDATSGRWLVPKRYNVAEDVADRHEESAVAMIIADHRGGERIVRWGELRGRSYQFARLYKLHGVDRGDVAAVLLDQSPTAAAAYLGALRVGAVLMTMSTLWAPDQIRDRLASTGARVLVTTRDILDGLDTVPPEVTVLLTDDDLLSGISADAVVFETWADDPAHLYFTSGTTGPAKALMHAQRSLIGHNEFAYTHGLRRGDLFYGAGEWAWSHAKLFGPWRYGAAQLVYRSERGFDARAVFDALVRYGVSSALLNPTVLRLAMAEYGDGPGAQQWRLRGVASSNEPLDPALGEWFRETTGASIREYYGLTESYPMLGYALDDEVVPRSTGRPLPGWDVVLLDADGRPDAGLAEGELGLRARSNPQYPLGYWGNEQASARSFGGEWFRSGDLFRRDGDLWYFVGRNDDVIKTSGYRVGPAEIEDVLLSHPDVHEAGVIGSPDDRRGQIIHAFVTVHDGMATGLDRLAGELRELVREQHSRFAYPRLITFAPSLPKSSTGKVQRSALRRIDVESDPTLQTYRTDRSSV